MKTRIAAMVCGLSIAGAGVLSAGMHSGALADALPQTVVQATATAQSADCATDQANDSDAMTENDEGTQGPAQAGDENEQHDQNDDHGADASDQGENETDMSDAGSEKEATAAAGQLSEGQHLLPQAKITVDQAVAAATGAASGTLGDVELRQQNSMLVFAVQVGDQDVLVDATNGAVISAQTGDTDAEDQACDDDATATPIALVAAIR